MNDDLGLTEQEVVTIKREQQLRFANIVLGKAASLLQPLLRPPIVRILMLVDTNVSYNQFYFGLSEVLDTLRTNREGFVTFNVTRAHRFQDPNKPPAGTPAYALYGPHVENFRLDTTPPIPRFDASGKVVGTTPFNLNDYDELWLFGFNSSRNKGNNSPPSPGAPPPPALTDSELAILFRWMDERDGGVLAMGDHEDLGASLCAEIPRVRSMRNWKYTSSIPSSAPQRDPDDPNHDPREAPSVDGPFRHDTLRPGLDVMGTALNEASRFTFDDESDDVPMQLRLRNYFRFSAPRKLEKSIHPIMCGTFTKGPIQVFPDHPHEGEVVEPKDLGQTVSFQPPAANPALFTSYSAREYPNLGARPLAPEIIAWAQVTPGITATSSFKGRADPVEFGAVGAYDGHKVSVGRVVVDSTWHHWFDVNLTGRMNLFTDIPGNVESQDNRKLQGFTTAAGTPHLEKIRNYFRNVAIWLAPPKKQKQMVSAAMRKALLSPQLLEELRSDLPVATAGKRVRDVLTSLYGACAVGWFLPILLPRFPKPSPLEPDKALFQEASADIQGIEEMVLGGIAKELLTGQRLDVTRLGSLDDKVLEDKVVLGAQKGLTALIELDREKPLLGRQLQEELRAVAELKLPDGLAG
jgi:hypothetical protein